MARLANGARRPLEMKSGRQDLILRQTVPHSRFEPGHGRRRTLAAASSRLAPATDGTHQRQPRHEEVCPVMSQLAP